ncbi:MAG TPA: hypothetical protein VKR79_03820, partial [Gaiellaceae bacterium]|nr:hypothetical protein [Gaiellaceae bacterium]
MATHVSRGDLLLAAVLVVVVVAGLSQLHSRPAHRIVADPRRTPGVLNPDVTQTNIRTTICRTGWTRTVRPPVSYTNDLKRRQLREYGLRGPPSAFQE